MLKLAVYGRPGDWQARVSAYDLTGGSKAFVEAINTELGLLPRTLGPTEMRSAAVAILRRHGIVGPDAGGWYQRGRAEPR